MRDRIQNGEFKVTYCPTELIVVDFFTKTLQGSLFKQLSAVIMGEIDLHTFLNSKPSSPKERVDNVKHTVVVEVLDDRGNDVIIKNKDTYADVVKGNRSKKII